MSYFLDENIFETLNKIDLDENLDPSVDGEALLYEDNEFSKTPAEADLYRTTTEDVLGFELDGNQVEYLATNWPAFYHDAKKYSFMKDQMIEELREQGFDHNLPKENSNLTSNDLTNLDDIDYHEDNPDVLHPHQEVQPSQAMSSPIEQTESINQPQVKAKAGFSPMQVQAWDTPKVLENTEPQDNLTELNEMANEMVDDDIMDDDDDGMLTEMLKQPNN